MNVRETRETSTSRRRVLQLGVAAGGGLMFPNLAILGVADAQEGESDESVLIRNRVSSNPAYAASQFIEEFLPDNYEVEWVDLGSKSFSAFVAMQRRLLDYNLGGYTYLVSSYAAGELTTCVSGLANGAQRVIVRRDSGVQELADLAGKRIAVAELSSTDIKFMAALQSVGVDPHEDVERIDVGNMGGARAAIEQGQVEAAVMWEPTGSQAIIENPDLISIDTLSEKAWGSQGGLYVLQSLIDNTPEDVQAVVDAVVRSVEQLSSDPETFITFCMEETGLSREIIEEAVRNVEVTYTVPLDELRTLSTWMVDLGLIERDVSAEIEVAVNYDFLVAATGQDKEQLGYSEAPTS